MSNKRDNLNFLCNKGFLEHFLNFFGLYQTLDICKDVHIILYHYCCNYVLHFDLNGISVYTFSQTAMFMILWGRHFLYRTCYTVIIACPERATQTSAVSNMY